MSDFMKMNEPRVTIPGTIAISTGRYFELLRAERDLELLKKNYRDSDYGVDSAVEKTILGPKPEPPAPDPFEQAINAALSAAESAKKAADMAAKMASAAMGEDNHA